MSSLLDRVAFTAAHSLLQIATRRATKVLELSNVSHEIIILATWTIPETTEDDSHGVAVVTLLQELARRWICNINTNIKAEPAPPTRWLTDGDCASTGVIMPAQRPVQSATASPDHNH